MRETAERDVPPGDEPIRHTFHLRRGIELRVHEVGTAPARLGLTLEKQAGEYWRTRDRQGAMPRPARRTEVDGWSYTGLEPGTYRIRIAGGTIFGPAMLAFGGPAEEITLDYTRIAAIRGRIEMPEGEGFGGVTLSLEGDRIEMEALDPWSSNGLRPNPKDGTFEIFIPGDRKVKLSVRHVRLAPDPKRGSIETVGGVNGVVLALVPGPTVRFRIPQYFEKHAEQYAAFPTSQRPRVEVRLFRGEVAGRPEFSVFARAEDREWQGGGFLPGTYTLWIDVPESVPVVRRDVKLEAETDLGDLPMERGSTLRLRVPVRKPLVPPRISVWAVHLGEPRYSRGVNSNGEDVVLVTGLAAGRYQVSGGAVMQMGVGTAPRLAEEIEVDGSSDVERTLDLR